MRTTISGLSSYQARRIATILVKMKSVQKYATKPYVQGERIADFGAASQEDEQ